jgi:hypothetical protein
VTCTRRDPPRCGLAGRGARWLRALGDRSLRAGSSQAETRVLGCAPTPNGFRFSENRADPGPAIAFDEQRSDPELSEERARIAALFEAEPDKELGLVAEMDFEEPEDPVVYVCAMHPEVVSDEPGSC